MNRQNTIPTQDQIMAKVLAEISEKYKSSEFTVAEFYQNCDHENLFDKQEWYSMDRAAALKRLAEKGFVEFDGKRISINPSLSRIAGLTGDKDDILDLQLDRLSEPFGAEED